MIDAVSLTALVCSFRPEINHFSQSEAEFGNGRTLLYERTAEGGVRPVHLLSAALDERISASLFGLLLITQMSKSCTSLMCHCSLREEVLTRMMGVG